MPRAILIAWAFSAPLFTLPFRVTTPRTVSASMLCAFTISSAASAAFTFALMAASAVVVTGPRRFSLVSVVCLPLGLPFRVAQPATPRASAAQTANAYEERAILMLIPPDYDPVGPMLLDAEIRGR